jgi:hypothetical protein
MNLSAPFIMQVGWQQVHIRVLYLGLWLGLQCILAALRRQRQDLLHEPVSAIHYAGGLCAGWSHAEAIPCSSVSSRQRQDNNKTKLIAVYCTRSVVLNLLLPLAATAAAAAVVPGPPLQEDADGCAALRGLPFWK